MKRPLITLALILAAALAIIAYRDSQIPRATATVQVHPSMVPTPLGGLVTTSYMENEYEFIHSEKTMILATKLLAIEKSQQAKAIPQMQKNVVTAPIRGTDFITITAKDPNPQKAANIANAIAEAYAQRRSLAAEARVIKHLLMFDEHLATGEAIVEAHRLDLTKLLKEKGLKFPSDSQTFPNLDTFTQGYPDAPIGFEYIQAIETFTKSRAMLRELKIKQREARVLLKMPQHPITIHKRAE